MTPQEYLKNRLETCSQYKLTDSDKRYIGEYGLKVFLYKQITRKKFRKWKVQEKSDQKIRNAIEYCVENSKPIRFRFAFGGYKLWRFPTTPEIDWAEFFTTAYYSEYLAPIAKAHEPGVELIYSSDDCFVEWLNNIPKSDTDAYRTSFLELIKQFETYVPKNLRIRYFRHKDLFSSQEELEEKFFAQVKELKDTWRSTRTQEELERNIATSWMNIKWDGVEDLSHWSEEQKQEKIEQSILYHDALVSMTDRKLFASSPDIIGIFVQAFPTSLGLGSTKASITKFWVGTGVLEKKQDSYLERILSITQYEALKDVPYKEEKINLIPLKNFKTVRVYNEIPNFSQKVR